MTIPVVVLFIAGLVIILLAIGLISSLGNASKFNELTVLLTGEREQIKKDRIKLNAEVESLNVQIKEINKVVENQKIEIDKRNHAIVNMSKHHNSESFILNHHKNIEVQAVLRKYDVLINDYIKTRISELQLSKPDFKGADQILVDISDLTKAKKENTINPEQYLDKLKVIFDTIQKG